MAEGTEGRRMVLLEFSGKELLNGRIFDTTSEGEAKANGLFRENAVFKPVPVIVGHRDLLAGLDEEVSKMKEGEERVVRLPPAKAFGERRKDLVVVVPSQQFAEHKIRPAPGLIVDLNGTLGRVQTVSGGRVRIDMNNDLAGKEVEYKLKIVKEISSPPEKCQFLLEKFFPLRGAKAESKLDASSGKLSVMLPKEIAAQVSQLVPVFTKTVKEVVPSITEVSVSDSLESAEKGGLKSEEGQAKNKAVPAEAAHVSELSQKTPGAPVGQPVAEGQNASEGKGFVSAKKEVFGRTSGTKPSTSTASTAIWKGRKKYAEARPKKIA